MRARRRVSPAPKGWPRKTGARLANLSEAVTDAKTVWQHATIPGWYGEGERRVKRASATAMWRRSSHPVAPIRRVLVRDPLGRFTPQALLCTTLRAQPRAGVAIRVT